MPSQLITGNFFKELFALPSQIVPTLFDEMRWALENFDRPISQASQFVGESHGPYSGGSPQLSEQVGAMTSGIQDARRRICALDDPRLKQHLADFVVFLETLKQQMDDIRLARTSSILSMINPIMVNIDFGQASLSRLISTGASLRLNRTFAYDIFTEYMGRTYTEGFNLVEITRVLRNKILDFYNSNRGITTEMQLVGIIPQLETLIHDSTNYRHFLEPIVNSVLLNRFGECLVKTENNLNRYAGNLNRATQLVEDAISGAESSIGRINDVSAAHMDAPFLREFVAKAQQLHPAVNMFIRRNIDKFPYFQQVSESIGSLYHVAMNISSIDPMKWLKSGGIDDLTTSNSIPKILHEKLFPPIASLIDETENVLNTMFLRASNIKEMTFQIRDYAAGKAIAHGLDFCQDVFHQARIIESKMDILLQLFSQFNDKIRLLNQLCPVQINAYIQHEVYDISLEGKKNTVDQLNRVYRPRKLKDEESLSAKPEGREKGGIHVDGKTSDNK